MKRKDRERVNYTTGNGGREIEARKKTRRRSMVDLDEDGTVERERGRGRKKGRKEALKRARVVRSRVRSQRAARLLKTNKNRGPIPRRRGRRMPPRVFFPFPSPSLPFRFFFPPLPAIPARHYARILNAEYYEILSRNLPPGRPTPRFEAPLSLSLSPHLSPFPGPPYEISTINARPCAGPPN